MRKKIMDMNRIKLKTLTNRHIDKMLSVHDSDGGNSINASLSKLFDCMNNESNSHEVQIKVAALNQIYSTSIQYISPVVDKIVRKVSPTHTGFTNREYAKLVDKIATVKWVSPTTGKHHSRCNLSFASKYVHFLSGRKIPIYDSYIWIVMIGYCKQYGVGKYSFSPPKNYSEFHSVFTEFKQELDLTNRSNYEIDKFLWQYGKDLLNEIIGELGVNLGKAKTELKKRIGRYS